MLEVILYFVFLTRQAGGGGVFTYVCVCMCVCVCVCRRGYVCM